MTTVDRKREYQPKAGQRIPANKGKASTKGRLSLAEYKQKQAAELADFIKSL